MNRKFVLVYMFFLISCGNGDINHITGNYYMVSAEVEEETALSYHDPSDGPNYGYVISSTVFAVGYNKNYIIAKQHPYNNKKITNYFILPVKKESNWRTKKDLIGPLSLPQFEKERIRLNIKGMKFKIVYEDLK